MSNYTVETWTIRDVANAFIFKQTSTDPTDRKVIIPIFQRGLRWESKKRQAFIDSLERDYPFGSLLFAKQDGINKYSVVDGLQRGSTICEYVFNPLGEGNFTQVDPDILDAIRLAIFPDNQQISINAEIEKVILGYFHEQKQFNKIDIVILTQLLINNFPNEEDKFELINKINSTFRPYLEKLTKTYNTICGSAVPIVVYSGRPELLNEIFKRINRNGTPLNDYEIYSATWDPRTYTINDGAIVDKVIKKYWSLSSKGFEIDGFDATAMQTLKQLNAFEFLFGLGKLWREKYDCLKFKATVDEDEVDEVSFEIVDACLNTSKSISTLDKKLQTVNVNKLKRRIEEAIQYVSDAISVISSFKGNSRKSKVLHSKYQIISMIAYTFRAMYDVENLDEKRISWDSAKQRKFADLLLNHYVFDIITNEWHEGGGGRVYSVIKERLYDEEITRARWETTLDSYYQNQLSNKQHENFSNPTNADSVILNCIYVNLFSAAQQLSGKRFDIEHIATRERMRSLLKNYEELKLPVSCIANLCYLPEDINRGKKEKTIYEADGLSLPISEIESKYSFTTKDDLEWISYPYGFEDKSLFVNYFQQYLDKRYIEMKRRFINHFFPE